MLKNANIGQARAVIILFPDENDSYGGSSIDRNRRLRYNKDSSGDSSGMMGDGGDGGGGSGGGGSGSGGDGIVKTQQELDQRQDFATSLVENNFVENGTLRF